MHGTSPKYSGDDVNPHGGRRASFAAVMAHRSRATGWRRTWVLMMCALPIHERKTLVAAARLQASLKASKTRADSRECRALAGTQDLRGFVNYDADLRRKGKRPQQVVNYRVFHSSSSSD